MRYIVDFIAGTTEDAITAYFATNKCTVVEELNHLGLTYIVDSEAEPATGDIIEEIVADDEHGITLLSDTLEYKTFEVEKEDNWWKVAVIDGVNYEEPTCEIVRTGQGHRVYLLDSGIDIDHPEFKGKDITLLHSKTADFIDGSGHGTALASVIVGETCGITEASLRIVKVFEKGQPTLVSEVLTALQKVAEDYVNDANHTAVLNISWTIKKNDYVENKLAALIEKGMIVVAAAGNSGEPIPDVTPASMVDVVTVGSFGPDLKPSNFTNYTGSSDTSLTAGATNYGPGLDLFAPGEQIPVALPGGELGYTAGTSVAAAITSAVILLNLTVASANLDLAGYDFTMFSLRNRRVTTDILTLEGDYATSPNRIPRVNITKPDPEEERFASPQIIVPGGKPFAMRIFDKPFYSDLKIVNSDITDMSVSDNFIVGTSPEVGKLSGFRGIVEMTRSDGEAVQETFAVTVYNPTIYPTDADLMADADMRLAACGCGTDPCCSACVKGVCNGGSVNCGHYGSCS